MSRLLDEILELVYQLNNHVTNQSTKSEEVVEVEDIDFVEVKPPALPEPKPTATHD